LEGGLSFWLAWAFILFAQQFTYLFSGRAKASGSLKYSFYAGLGSHTSWFFSNLYFIASVLNFRNAPVWQQGLVCAFYVLFTLSGTLSAQYLAMRYEKGKSRVGA